MSDLSVKLSVGERTIKRQIKKETRNLFNCFTRLVEFIEASNLIEIDTIPIARELSIDFTAFGLSAKKVSR